MPLAGRLERRARRAALVAEAAVGARAPACSRTAVGGEDPDAGPDRQRQRVGRPGVDLDRPPVALEDEPGVERLLGQLGDDDPVDPAPSSSSVVANRSWVSGRSGVRPWSFIAIALASHGPIQIGR